MEPKTVGWQSSLPTDSLTASVERRRAKNSTSRKMETVAEPVFASFFFSLEYDLCFFLFDPDWRLLTEWGKSAAAAPLLSSKVLQNYTNTE